MKTVCRKVTPKQAVAQATKRKGKALSAAEKRIVMAEAKALPRLVCKRSSK